MKRIKEDADRVFALDIGTRSVIGIVGRMEGDVFNVELLDSEEYATRAVVDGQIENIEETAKVAIKVKKRLEERLGQPLRTVYVAAAGRVLKTAVAQSRIQFPADQMIDEPQVDELEREAVRIAYEEVTRKDSEHDLFCVGYSVKSYELDGYRFSSLIGHRGHNATVSMIVTFLPKEVVDSLYTTMSQIGLTVAGLTLEPIAAMNAIVPQDLRKLNLALCDIGAGTSDIAICDQGSIVSYGVATVAGDEISEALMQSCLVDFDTAEQIKRQLSAENKTVVYEDIIGLQKEQPVEEVVAGIIEAVDVLAQTIADKILAANERQPNAVFLVGGGSQTPGLKARLATALGISEDRVAVGGKVHMKRMFTSEYDIAGPEFATPLGIAWTAAQRSSAGSLAITINGKKMHLFNVWDSTILGVLQTAGYRYGQIVGSNGRSVIYTLNGQRRTAYGGLPTVAEIRINGRQGNLTDTIKAGDEIQFTPSTPGADAVVRVRDLLEPEQALRSFTITFDDAPYDAGTLVLINGERCARDVIIKNGDAVEVRSVHTADDLAQTAGADPNDLIFVNGVLKTREYKLQPGDRVRVMAGTAAAPRTGSPEAAEQQAAEPQQSPETAPQPAPQSGEEAPAAAQPGKEAPAEPRREQPPAEPPVRAIKVRLNDRELELPDKENGEPYLLYDLLPLTGLDLNNPRGVLTQKRNGHSAAYTEIISDGDNVTFDWEN